MWVVLGDPIASIPTLNREFLSGSAEAKAATAAGGGSQRSLERFRRRNHRSNADMAEFSRM